MKMMDVRKKILDALDKNPGEMSISQIARIIGSNNKSTNAALSKLYKNGLVARPQKGLYTSKGGPAVKASTPEPAAPAPAPAPKKAAPKAVVAKASGSAPAIHVVAIELLVEGEQSAIDPRNLVDKLLENKSVLDARIKGITAADQSKLRIRVSFGD